jgi:hypothetical protein
MYACPTVDWATVSDRVVVSWVCSCGRGAAGPRTAHAPRQAATLDPCSCSWPGMTAARTQPRLRNTDGRKQFKPGRGRGKNTQGYHLSTRTQARTHKQATAHTRTRARVHAVRTKPMQAQEGRYTWAGMRTRVGPEGGLPVGVGGEDVVVGAHKKPSHVVHALRPPQTEGHRQRDR